jgi:site-specific DNA-methyltransferase (adenine-specific)
MQYKALFPEKLPYLCIKLHGVKPDMIVYDPFMGIGTTALACISLGVNYLGTEIDSEYVKVAVEDIEKRKNSGVIDDWLEKKEKENEILFK